MKYYIPDHAETPEDGVPLEDGEHDEDTAVLAAEHHYSARDGWESGWPLVIALVDDAGTESRWKVDLDCEPTFRAGREET